VPPDATPERAAEVTPDPNKHSTAIAVLNSSDDTVEMLRACLQQEGYTAVVTAHIEDIKRGRLDFMAFLAEHDPGVLIYDIAIPYEDNWKFLQLLMSSEEMQGRRVVMTTTNKRVLESFVGKTEAIEIHGKPYDLREIVQSVKAAAAVVARRGT
jgi:DNA-binding NtrC family response regulator